MQRFHPSLLLGVIVVLLATVVPGCDLILTLDLPSEEGSGSLPAGEPDAGAERDGPPPGSDLISLEEGKATRIYYQFVDERGRVRFVESLERVPEKWRDRVGFVESATPPPMSPTDMARAIEPDARRLVARLEASRKASGPKVIIYSANWCGACRRAKAYMDRKGVRYEERNVDQPRFKEELVRKSGGRSIPVIEVNGRILKGFNPERLDKLLADAA